MRYLLGKARNPLDLKFLLGLTTAETYVTWARKNGADVLTDELSEGATLHWIGPRREDRILLFLHGTYFSLSDLGGIMLIGEEGCSGGGYVVPAGIDCFNMLGSIHKEYKGAVGIAMLNYCTSSCDV